MYLISINIKEEQHIYCSSFMNNLLYSPKTGIQQGTITTIFEKVKQL